MNLTIYDQSSIQRPVSHDEFPQMCGRCVHFDKLDEGCTLFWVHVDRQQEEQGFGLPKRAKKCIDATGWHVDYVFQSPPPYWCRSEVHLRAGHQVCVVAMSVDPCAHPTRSVKLSMDQTRAVFRGRMALAIVDHVAGLAARIVELLQLGCEPADAWRRVVGKDGTP